MKTRFFTSAVLGLALVALAPYAQAQSFSDTFDDATDDGWTHLSGYTASSGQTWTVGGGQYRLQAPLNGLQGYGFVGSYAGPSLSDGRIEVDFVNFSGPGANPVFGVAGRLNGLNGFGQLNGYGYAFEPFAAGLTGEMVLYKINNNVALDDLGSQQVSLDPAKDYRFVLEFSGNTIHGQVFEIGGGMVAEAFATDTTAPYASGYSGILGYGQNGVTPPVDFSLDNFSVVVPEPSLAALMVLGALALGIRRRA